MQCLARSFTVPVASKRAAAASRVAVRSAGKIEPITGIVFESSIGSEVAPIVASVSNKDGTTSYARQNFHEECEAAINDQVNTEYSISYIYHALYAYFARDNVALPGLAAYFKAASEEEREHAELLMDYQIKRGGRVKLAGIMAPPSEFAGDATKGDALSAMELVLSLEKLNLQKLTALHDVAEKHEDVPLADFIEGSLLEEQVDAVNKCSEMVAQLKRVGKGVGTYMWDRELLEEVQKAA